MYFKTNSNEEYFLNDITEVINTHLELKYFNSNSKSIKFLIKSLNIKVIISPINKTFKNKNYVEENLTFLNQKTRRPCTTGVIETNNISNENLSSENTDIENSNTNFDKEKYRIAKDNKSKENKNNNQYKEFLSANKSLSEKMAQNSIDKTTKNVRYSKSTNYKYNGKEEIKEKKKIKENEDNVKNSKLLEQIKEEKAEIIEKEPKGLYNFGLNCYMNSLLQCFFYIKELREFFINTEFKENQITCKALANVMKGLESDDGKSYFEPREFKTLIGKKNKLFEGCKAADVKDLFFNLIDSIMFELDEDFNPEESESPEINFNDKNCLFKETEKEINKENIINKLFVGYYIYEYECKKYNIPVYSFQNESFLLFELTKIKKYFENIGDNGKLSIEKCLKYYSREQSNSSFYCNKCQDEQFGKAREKIYRPPEILTIILDRGKGKKFEEEVEIKKTLDLKDWIAEEDYEYNTTYNLICISTHKGSSSSSGHYIACCQTDKDKNIFYYFSDTYVHKISEENLFKDEPYLLFYKRGDIGKENNKQKYKGDEVKENKLEVNKVNNITPFEENKNKESIESNQKNKEINETKEQSITTRYRKREVIKKYLDLKYISTKISNNNKDENENTLKIVESKNNKIKEKEKDNDKMVKIKKENKFYSFGQKEIQETLDKFLLSYSRKYKVNYYYESHDPNIWRLTIRCPRDSIYKNKQINFKLDFNKGFNKITDNIKIEYKIYHINFAENGLLLFDREYQENKNLYQNLLELFDLIYGLFIEPNLEISEKFSKTKINLYKRDKNKYLQLAEKSVEIMEKI